MFEFFVNPPPPFYFHITLVVNSIPFYSCFIILYTRIVSLHVVSCNKILIVKTIISFTNDKKKIIASSLWYLWAKKVNNKSLVIPSQGIELPPAPILTMKTVTFKYYKKWSEAFKYLYLIKYIFESGLKSLALCVSNISYSYTSM